MMKDIFLNVSDKISMTFINPSIHYPLQMLHILFLNTYRNLKEFYRQKYQLRNNTQTFLLGKIFQALKIKKKLTKNINKTSKTSI